MPISSKITDSIERSSWIRKMFEEGALLKQKYGEDNVFDFSLGNPDLDPPDEFNNVLKDLIQDSDYSVHRYMPNAGFPYVRDSIAKMVSNEHCINIEGKHIIMTCGAAGALNVVFKTILNPGDQVIVLKPFFAEYEFYINNHMGQMVLVDTKDNFSLNIENIDKVINEKVKAVLINSPNNPTGRVYSNDEIIELAKLLDQYAKMGNIIYLISDEPYREIVFDGISVPSILKNYNHSIIVTSFSKSMSIAGERIGYIAVNPFCMDIDMLLSGFIFSNRTLGFVNAPALMQRVVAKLCDISVNIVPYKRRRDIFLDGLKTAGYEFIMPDGTFYIFCKSPIIDDIKYVKHLLNFNILVVPGSGFGTPGYFRIAYCVSDDIINRSIPKFKEAIESISQRQK